MNVEERSITHKIKNHLGNKYQVYAWEDVKISQKIAGKIFRINVVDTGSNKLFIFILSDNKLYEIIPQNEKDIKLYKELKKLLEPEV